MPTERLAFLTLGVAIAVAILVAAPISIPDGWDKVAHFIAFSALTLCLWRATSGAMPVLVIGAVVVFGALDEYRQLHLPHRVSDAKDFLANLAAALSTGALLFTQRKSPCAESSPR